MASPRPSDPALDPRIMRVADLRQRPCDRLECGLAFPMLMHIAVDAARLEVPEAARQAGGHVTDATRVRAVAEVPHPFVRSSCPNHLPLGFLTAVAAYAGPAGACCACNRDDAPHAVWAITEDRHGLTAVPLCAAHAAEYFARDLRPDAFRRVVAYLGVDPEDVHLLHGDFYDATGRAWQPMPRDVTPAS